MKSIRFIISSAVIVLICALPVGCGKKDITTDITAVTPTQMGTVDPAITGNDTNPGTPSPAGNGKGPGVSQTPAGDGSNQEGQPVTTPTPDTGADPTGTVPTEKPDTADVTPDGEDGENGQKTTPEPTGMETDNTEDDDDDDPDENNAETDEYWEGSFLVWLPRFKKGSFSKFNSDETHDFLTLENVSEESVRKYIKTLTKRGFSIDTAYTDAEGNVIAEAEETEERHFIYSAENEDGWSAMLDYDPETRILTIGSGYQMAETTDVYGQLRDETALGLIPEFTYGDFDSSKQDGEMYYAIFSNVTGKYGRYVEQLKKAGFTEDADEGDVDGILWYNAVNEEGYSCEFIYSDGVVRIGCGMPE
ncbi:MAG: hypothetical protein J5824_02035 [Lachnospiraceae bacterium]|nr:hypothetical protein [Lachnospiraceae bacterium]